MESGCKWIGCCLLSMLSVQGIQAQFYTGNDVDGARWSLGFTGGVFVRPILSDNPQRVSTGDGSESFGIKGEYFLPKKWAVYAGYERTELNYGYSSRSLEGIGVGVKRYFVPDRWFVQPYLGAGWLFNWGDRHEDSTTGASSGNWSIDVRQKAVNPRAVFVPSVGVDFYLFSSVAFVIRYDLGLGLGSHTQIEAVDNKGVTYQLRDKGMYQRLNLGIKVTFPMRFSQQDGFSLGGIIGSLIENWFYRLDQNSREYYYR